MTPLQTAPRPNPGRRRLRRSLTVLVAAVVGGTVGAGVEGIRGGDASSAAPATTVAAATTTAAATTQPVAITSTALSAEQIYAQDGPGVVDIQVTGSSSQQGDPYGRTDEQQGEGSGFVLDTKGDIVTNYHVIDGATKITVTLADGTKATATLAGSDASTDLAVIRISVPSDKLVPLTLAEDGQRHTGRARGRHRQSVRLREEHH